MSYVRIIPLGGVREFGLNSMVVETSRGSILIDAGLMFPRYTLLGIDQIVPDFRYVVDNQEAFQGIVLTHGHEDHIGALPYLLKDAPIPVYGHPFTLELVKRKLKEFEMNGSIDLIQRPHTLTPLVPGPIQLYTKFVGLSRKRANFGSEITIFAGVQDSHGLPAPTTFGVRLKRCT